MITLPNSIPDALAAEGELRAGGTDVMERRRSGRSKGDVVDLRDLRAGPDEPAFDQIALRGDLLEIGAGVRIAALAEHPDVPKGLRDAANGLATPQIRAVATVGGNLSQHVRCWYYRNADFSCWKAGGTGCPAREGDHRWHSCFGSPDKSPCVAVHPSTLAAAFMGYEAELFHVAAPGDAPKMWDVGEFLKAGAARPHGPSGLLHHVRLWVPKDPEKTAYLRATSRSRSEWPLVEAFVRLRWLPSASGPPTLIARVVAGGVAPTPIRLGLVESMIQDKSDEYVRANLDEIASKAVNEASPLPMTAYKPDLLARTVRDGLERALGAL